MLFENLPGSQTVILTPAAGISLIKHVQHHKPCEVEHDGS
jgi:hypothetical protein